MRPLLALALLFAASACAVIEPRPTPRVVSLPRLGSSPVQQTVTAIGDTPIESLRGHSRRFEIESAALTRAFGRPRTVGAEVVLPEGFRPGEELAVAYHIPDLGQDPAQLAEHFAEITGLPRLVLVVLDPRGIYGHHAFIDSVNEGPQGEALVTDLIPVLEQHLFAGASARRRFLSGVGLGGWSAIQLQLEYRHAFDAAFAFDPEPLDLRSFYGVDLTSALLADGSTPAPRLKTLREGNLGSRLASLESALGARGPDGRPMPLLARGGGALDPDVVAAFARRDPATHVRLRGKELASRLQGKIHALAHQGDALGRDDSLRSFQSALTEAGVPSVVRVLEAFDFDEVIAAAWASMVDTARP